MSQDSSTFLLGGSSAPGAKFEKVGDEHTLTITEPPELRQQTDYGSGEPLTWSDGKPRMQLVVTGEIEPSKRDGADDDGLRRFYLKGESQKAVGAAVREAGAKDLEVGGKLWMKYTGDAKAGNFNKKLYTAKYKAPEPGTSVSASFLSTSTAEPQTSEPPFHNGFLAGNPYRDMEQVV